MLHFKLERPHGKLDDMSILQVLITVVCTISVQWLSLLGHVGTISLEEAAL